MSKLPKKKSSVHIKTIITYNHQEHGEVIIGLGNDDRLYQYHPIEGYWFLHLERI